MEKRVSEIVWRRGWRREAAATQAAAREIAAFIDWLERRGLGETAQIVRTAAMKYGALQAAKEMVRVFVAEARRRRAA